MKFLTFAGFLRIGFLALVLTFAAGPAFAQSNTNTTTSRTTTVDRDDDTDWGWIGLLGLLGLAGLIPKKRTVDHDRVDTGNRTTTH